MKAKARYQFPTKKTKTKCVTLLIANSLKVHVSVFGDASYQWISLNSCFDRGLQVQPLLMCVTLLIAINEIIQCMRKKERKMRDNFWRWISWLTYRWRTQPAAICSVNCRIQCSLHWKAVLCVTRFQNTSKVYSGSYSIWYEMGCHIQWGAVKCSSVLFPFW